MIMLIWIRDRLIVIAPLLSNCWCWFVSKTILLVSFWRIDAAFKNGSFSERPMSRWTCPLLSQTSFLPIPQNLVVCFFLRICNPWTTASVIRFFFDAESSTPRTRKISLLISSGMIIACRKTSFLGFSWIAAPLIFLSFVFTFGDVWCS